MAEKHFCDVCRKEIDPKVKPMLALEVRRGNRQLSHTVPEICEECGTNGVVVKVVPKTDDSNGETITLQKFSKGG